MEPLEPAKLLRFIGYSAIATLAVLLVVELVLVLIRI